MKINGFDYFSVWTQTETHWMCHLNGIGQVMKICSVWALNTDWDYQFLRFDMSMPIHLCGYKIFFMLFCICSRKNNHCMWYLWSILHHFGFNGKIKTRAWIRNYIYVICVQCRKIWIFFHNLPVTVKIVHNHWIVIYRWDVLLFVLIGHSHFECFPRALTQIK